MVQSLARLAKQNEISFHQEYLTGLMLHNKYTLGDASLALTWKPCHQVILFPDTKTFALHSSAWYAASLLSPPNTREQLK